MSQREERRMGTAKGPCPAQGTGDGGLRSGVPGVGPHCVDPVFAQCLLGDAALHAPVVNQSLEGCNDYAVAVDLEEAAQRGTRVAAAEAVSPQGDIPARRPRGTSPF